MTIAARMGFGRHQNATLKDLPGMVLASVSGGASTSRYWEDASKDACAYANVGDRTLKEKYSG